MKYFEEKEGSIFFIPLFLPSSIKENTKSYSTYKFDAKSHYAFGRLIQTDKSGGDLVEIFKYQGAVPENASTILNSGLLLNPLHVSMGFSKKRWRFVFENKNYKASEDSNFDNICFLLGEEGRRVLWRGGKKESIQSVDASIDEWIVYPATKVENLIRSLINKP